MTANATAECWWFFTEGRFVFHTIRAVVSSSQLDVSACDGDGRWDGQRPTAQQQRRRQGLATLEVTGSDVPTLPAVAVQGEPRDLRGAAIARRRELAFAMSMGGSAMNFTIDGRKFDPARIDQTVKAGTVEEWTLANTSPMDHPLHLHVWPMQLVEENGQPLHQPTWQDVVNIPARGKVRIAFDFAGRTVYHCHILDHEDQGMIGVDARKNR